MEMHLTMEEKCWESWRTAISEMENSVTSACTQHTSSRKKNIEMVTDKMIRIERAMRALLDADKMLDCVDIN